MKRQNVKRNLFLVTIAATVLLSGCGAKEAKPEAIVGECVIGGIEGPNWACGAYEDTNAYVAVGSAQISKAGKGFTRRNALADARSNLAQQIETEVKDKVESFMRSTGIGSDEKVDKVTTQVSKQVAKVTLNGSKQISYWENTGDNSIYLLVSVSKESVNQQVKESVISSFKNDDALWQQYQAKNALANLEKEFGPK